MTVGRSLSASDINSAAASLALSLFAVMDNVMKMKSVIDGYTSAQIASNFPPLTQADGDVLKSALTDMANMVAQWTGQATTGTMPRDHRAFAKQLLGTGLY